MPERLKRSRRASVFPSLILVVEDDDDTRLMLKYLLEIWNYEVLEAETDDEAFQTAIHYRPDLILMSINNIERKTERLAVSRRMRDIESLAQAVIIFVSTYADEKTRDAAFAAGGDDYLIKPIDFGLLEKRLENHLRVNAKSKEVPIGKFL